MKANIEKLRKKYVDHPPEGMTSNDIRSLSEEVLLDMDYFLNEDDLFDDEAAWKVFISSKPRHLSVLPSQESKLNTCHSNFCSFSSLEKSKFPIKQESHYCCLSYAPDHYLAHTFRFKAIYS